MESWCLMTVGFLSDLIQSLEISIADFRTMTVLYFGNLVFEIGCLYVTPGFFNFSIPLPQIPELPSLHMATGVDLLPLKCTLKRVKEVDK